MTVFDHTILNLILAGDSSEALDRLDQGHPTAFVQTIGATVENTDAKSEGTSSSTVAIGTGAKTLTLDSPRGLRAGTPVYIMEAGDPATNYMAGKLTVDETAGGVLQVNISHSGGTGTFTSWIIVALFAVATVVAPPVALADGGTGATSDSTARINLAVPRLFVVLDSLDDPPALPTSGDMYRVLPGAFNAWVGHDNEITTWNGSSWAYVTPVDRSPLCFDKDGDDLLYWNGSAWIFLNLSKPSRFSLAGHPIAIVFLASDLTGDDLFEFFVSGGSSDVTLPGDAGLEGYRVTFYNKSLFALTVRVSGAGTIDGSVTDNVPVGSKKVYARANSEWIVLNEYP